MQGHPRRTGHGGESSDNTRSTGVGNGKPLQDSASRIPLTVWKGKKDMTPKAEPRKSGGIQYATGEEWRNDSRQNEWRGWAKAEMMLSRDVSDCEIKEWSYKQQYCIGTWNVKFMNQGKLDVVK